MRHGREFDRQEAEIANTDKAAQRWRKGRRSLLRASPYVAVPLLTAGAILWLGKIPGLLPDAVIVDERPGDIGVGSDIRGVMVMFTSLTCIHCRAWHMQEFPKVMSEANKMSRRFLIRQHPKDFASLQGAAALLAVPATERLDAYSDMIAEGVPQWLASNDTPDAAKIMARESWALRKVSHDAAADAKVFSIQGTPSFLINRRVWLGGVSAERLLEAAR
jgi:hypothetical protein